MKKKLLLSIAIVTLAGVTYFGTGYAFAQSNDDQRSTLVEKIATKFGLKQADVQAVFDENRSERVANMQKRFDDQLTQLVKDGKLTESQKTKVIAKFAEMKKEREANKDGLKDKTPEERKTTMEKKHDDLKAWADANGIDLSLIQGAFGPHKGMGKPMK